MDKSVSGSGDQLLAAICWETWRECNARIFFTIIWLRFLCSSENTPYLPVLTALMLTEIDDEP